jgi:hypothetical protein
LGMSGSPDMIAAFDILLRAVLEKLAEVAAVKFEIAPKVVPQLSPGDPATAQPPPVTVSGRSRSR